MLVGVGKAQTTVMNPPTLPFFLATRYRSIVPSPFPAPGQWEMQYVNLPTHRLFVLGAGFSDRVPARGVRAWRPTRYPAGQPPNTAYRTR